MNLLVLIDISARLPYGVVLDIDTSDWKAPQGHIKLKVEGVGVLSKDMSLIVNGCYYGDKYKPYLRSMKDMTEEELIEFNNLPSTKNYQIVDGDLPWDVANYKQIDWLNKKMFDYRGLIPEGLALIAPEGMYK